MNPAAFPKPLTGFLFYPKPSANGAARRLRHCGKSETRQGFREFPVR